MFHVFFVIKHKSAYEMRISDLSSDVCSSDLPARKSCRYEIHTISMPTFASTLSASAFPASHSHIAPSSSGTKGEQHRRAGVPPVKEPAAGGHPHRSDLSARIRDPVGRPGRDARLGMPSERRNQSTPAASWKIGS